MLRPIALAAIVAAIALPAAAQPTFTGPTPAEQVGMFIGNAATNGSATVVEDRTGVHPDGFTGQSLVNPISAARAPSHRHHHHHDRASD
jgi:hypothetical protein